MRRSHVYLAFAGIAVGLLALATILLATGRSGSEQAATEVAEAPSVGGPFELVNAEGKTVTDRDFRGRWMLVFFGYTFCPDVCPTALANVALALEELGPLADRLAPVFVSIDPERDTPEVVGEYVRQFDPRIVGLTGSPEQVRRAAQAYRAFYRKVSAEATGGTGDDYLMEHSAWLYLMGPDGRFVKVFPHGVDPERLAADIASAMGEKPPHTSGKSS